MKTQEIAPVNVKQALVAAASYIRRGFCKKSYARDRHGIAVHFDDKSAVEWCALGAIQKVAGRGTCLHRETTAALQEAIKTAIPLWNDDGSITAEGVASTMERVAEKL